MFGNLYELGPAWVNESLQLVLNPGMVCLRVRSIACSGSQDLHSAWQTKRCVLHGKCSLLSFNLHLVHDRSLESPLWPAVH